MTVSSILILGAGPAGLSAALAISQLAPRPHITILELRPSDAATASTSFGGAVNLTPLAMGYLDRLGVGKALRPLGIPVANGIEILSFRTGMSLGSLWKGADALRVRRSDLVACLRDVVEATEGIRMRYGVRVAEIRENEEKTQVVLVLDSGEEVRGDVLLGCDGIHSVARRMHVEPGRKEVYSGKAAAYGFASIDEPGKARVTRVDGSSAVVDSTLISGRHGSLLISFFEPDRKELYLAPVIGINNDQAGEESSNGWKAKGADMVWLKDLISNRFGYGHIGGLTDLLGRVESWTFYPVHKLPPGGHWSRGRVLLLGDAAHAMPPQGESTGIAIEDGVLLARVLSRHDSRSVPQLFLDYEQLRRQPIDKLYKETVWRWNNAMTEDAGWLWGIFMEWLTVVFIFFTNKRQKDYFIADVGKTPLPP